MPDTRDFLRAFNLVRGAKINGSTILSVSATEHQIVRYRNYEFDITIKFDYVPDHLNFGEKIVNSHYGNPYRCDIDNIEYVDSQTITAIGYAERIYH